MTTAFPLKRAINSFLLSMPIKVSEMLDRLRADGWVQVAQRGSHRQFKHPTKPGRVTVAGKPGSDLAIGTEMSILKQADLRRDAS